MHSCSIHRIFVMWSKDYAHPDIGNANFKCTEPLNSTDPSTCEFIVEFLLFGYKRPRTVHFGMRYVTRYQNQGKRPKASQKHKTKQISSIVCILLVKNGKRETLTLTLTSHQSADPSLNTRFTQTTTMCEMITRQMSAQTSK